VIRGHDETCLTTLLDSVHDAVVEAFAVRHRPVPGPHPGTLEGRGTGRTLIGVAP
jgi:hypothetical protein